MNEYALGKAKLGCYKQQTAAATRSDCRWQLYTASLGSLTVSIMLCRGTEYQTCMNLYLRCSASAKSHLLLHLSRLPPFPANAWSLHSEHSPCMSAHCTTQSLLTERMQCNHTVAIFYVGRKASCFALQPTSVPHVQPSASKEVLCASTPVDPGSLHASN